MPDERQTQNDTDDTSDDNAIDDNASDDNSSGDSGFIRFYGLYWARSQVNWDNKFLLGQPSGWLGRGRIGRNFDYSCIQMNFWKQKGVYILYDDAIHPVYAGQAGMTRRNTRREGSCIGDRLRYHVNGRYRHAWSLFSWFGFCQTKKIDLKEASEDQKYYPAWDDTISSANSMNDVLASFEAILIEGFAPRFNARSGDLKTAVYVSQYDENGNYSGSN